MDRLKIQICDSAIVSAGKEVRPVGDVQLNHFTNRVISFAILADGGASKCTLGAYKLPDTTCSGSATVVTNVLEIASSVGEHRRPCEKHFIGKRIGKGPIQTDHHFGDALLRRFHAAIIGHQPKPPTDGRLHARAVQYIALLLAPKTIIGTSEATIQPTKIES
jgi:hypothetical protein